MNKFSKNIAFTLAEVLLVIGIIGTVSALTLPNLKNNSDERVNISKAKKVYSDLATAVDRTALKYPGSPNTWGASNTVNRMNNYLKIKSKSSDYWYQSGDCANVATGLADGASYCAESNSTTCMNILFDVDGPKQGYDTVGRDIFKASIRIPGGMEPIELRPWSCSDAASFSNTTKPGTENYLNWVVTYDNMDYVKCSSSLYYQNVTTCK